MRKFFKSEADANHFAKSVNDPFVYKESIESIGIEQYNSTPWCVEYISEKKYMRKVYKDGKIQFLPKNKKHK